MGVLILLIKVPSENLLFFFFGNTDHQQILNYVNISNSGMEQYMTVILDTVHHMGTRGSIVG
jgi:hypothetical protein